MAPIDVGIIPLFIAMQNTAPALSRTADRRTISETLCDEETATKPVIFGTDGFIMMEGVIVGGKVTKNRSEGTKVSKVDDGDTVVCPCTDGTADDGDTVGSPCTDGTADDGDTVGSPCTDGTADDGDTVVCPCTDGTADDGDTVGSPCTDGTADDGDTVGLSI